MRTIRCAIAAASQPDSLISIAVNGFDIRHVRLHHAMRVRRSRATLPSLIENGTIGRNWSIPNIRDRWHGYDIGRRRQWRY